MRSTAAELQRERQAAADAETALQVARRGAEAVAAAHAAACDAQRSAAAAALQVCLKMEHRTHSEPLPASLHRMSRCIVLNTHCIVGSLPAYTAHTIPDRIWMPCRQLPLRLASYPAGCGPPAARAATAPGRGCSGAASGTAGPCTLLGFRRSCCGRFSTLCASQICRATGQGNSL